MPAICAASRLRPGLLANSSRAAGLARAIVPGASINIAGSRIRSSERPSTRATELPALLVGDTRVAFGEIAMGWMMGLTGKYKDVTFKLKDRNVIGTAADCDIAPWNEPTPASPAPSAAAADPAAPVRAARRPGRRADRGESSRRKS